MITLVLVQPSLLVLQLHRFPLIRCFLILTNLKCLINLLIIINFLMNLPTLNITLHSIHSATVLLIFNCLLFYLFAVLILFAHLRIHKLSTLIVLRLLTISDQLLLGARFRMR
jgi:hypothetical protein